jgi:hypothetical protein
MAVETMSDRFVGVALASSLLAVACFPSRATRSASEVGCSADEIAISEAPVHEGLLQPGETWAAECHGRTYYCTQIHAERGADPLAAFMSDQVICQAEAESPQEEPNREARVDAKLRAAAGKSAPLGAAGFDFGLSSEESQLRCEAAGLEWTTVAESGHCSGPAAELGMAARVNLGFCENRACTITIEPAKVDRLATRAVRLKTQLEAKYGPAQDTSGRIPETCRTNASFEQCLQTGVLHLSYGWHWSSGESLELSVGKSAPDLEPALELVYSRPRAAANLSHL